MTVYFYWGEDEFAMMQAIAALRNVLNPDWASFNYEKIVGDRTEAVTQALNTALTPPFGTGGRLVWLADTTVCQQCSEALLSDLERIIPVIPSDTVLLLTSRTKPDGRLKSTKLLSSHAKVQEFSPIPPWKTEDIVKRVRQVAQEVGVRLTPSGVQLVAESIGNDSRTLWNELEKLRLYADSRTLPLDTEEIAALVTANTQNSLKLAIALRTGNVAEALSLVAALIAHNEPPLRITSTLIGQFRTWLWVKMMNSDRRDDKAIAQAAEISNPNRIYHLKKEVQSLTLSQLLSTLPLLLDLEISLKTGKNPLLTLQTTVIELCRVLGTGD